MHPFQFRPFRAQADIKTDSRGGAPSSLAPGYYISRLWRLGSTLIPFSSAGQGHNRSLNYAFPNETLLLTSWLRPKTNAILQIYLDGDRN